MKRLYQITAAILIPSLALFLGYALIANADSTSATFPGTGANNNTYTGGGFTNVWTNPGNITANDGAFARDNSNDGEPGNYLQASNFGFSIPAGATINGITLLINRRNNGSNADGGCLDNRVRLVNSAGTVTTTDKALTGTFWPLTTFGSASYGGASDLWGSAWTASDINNSNFGAVLSANESDPDGGNLDLCDVDYMTIAVTYTPAAVVVNGNIQIQGAQVIIRGGNTVWK